MIIAIISLSIPSYVGGVDGDYVRGIVRGCSSKDEQMTVNHWVWVRFPSSPLLTLTNNIMKEIYFKKIKGRVNPSPTKFKLLVEENNVREDKNAVTIICAGFLEYKRMLIFLKQYVFMQLDSDDKKMEIYMPKGYILCIKTVRSSLISGYF